MKPTSFALLCFLPVLACDSLVSDPCETGYHLDNGACVASHVAPPDGDPNIDPDAHPDGPPIDGSIVDVPPVDAPDGPDAPVCTADVETDPDNCGRCDHVCNSGLCSARVCLGDPIGHVVAIGHDYASYHLGMTLVLANAIAIGASPVVRVGWYAGTTSETVHITTHVAAQLGLAALGRQASNATITTPVFDGFDVVVVEPQQGDGDAMFTTGASWAAPLHDFLVAGGVVVVLEGRAGTSYRFAAGANLFTVAAPVEVTDQPATVVIGTDAIAHAVPVPYAAEGTSVVFPGVANPVITVGGEGIAFHRWVQ